MIATQDFMLSITCVNAEADDIDSMVDEAIEITWATMNKHCDLSEWEHETVPKLKNDWHVRYYKSTYRGQPCYYRDHSAIEHVFLRA